MSLFRCSEEGSGEKLKICIVSFRKGSIYIVEEDVEYFLHRLTYRFCLFSLYFPGRLLQQESDITAATLKLFSLLYKHCISKFFFVYFFCCVFE